MTSSGGVEELGGGEIEQNRKRTHGCGLQCGDCWGWGIRGLKGNVRKYNKD